MKLQVGDIAKLSFSIQEEGESDEEATVSFLSFEFKMDTVRATKVYRQSCRLLSIVNNGTHGMFEYLDRSVELIPLDCLQKIG